MLLEWTTGSELNNKQFVIERSLDGQQFEAIGIVNGKGSTNLLHQYEFIDQRPHAINYYRLKQEDFDGKYSYSNIEVVELKDTKEDILLVYPSIAQQEINIRFSSFETSTSLLKIVNSVGELLYEEIVVSTPNSEFRKIDLSDYEPGFYYISLTDGTEFATAKFVVIK